MSISNQIFLDSKKLLPNFVPPILLHRKEEIMTVASNFRVLFKSKKFLEGNSTNIVILGAPGNGKTTLAKYTMKHIINDGYKKNLNIIGTYTNGWQYRSFSGVLSSVFRQLRMSSDNLEIASGKGFSLEEQVSEIMMPYLVQNDSHLIITLDEINALPFEDVNSLFSITEEYGEHSRISLVLVSRPTEWHLLAAQSNLRLTESITLHPYTFDQLKDIIAYRASLALKPTAYDDDLVELITEIAFQAHNVRFGLEILYRSGFIAQSDPDNTIIGPEILRKAKSLVFPELRSEILDELKIHELLTLMGIARRLVNQNFTSVDIADAFRYYKIACLERDEDFKKESTFRNYIQVLKGRGLIDVILSPTGRGKRGIKSRIGFSDIPASIVIERVEEQLQLIDEL